MKLAKAGVEMPNVPALVTRGDQQAQYNGLHELGLNLNDRAVGKAFGTFA